MSSSERPRRRDRRVSRRRALAVGGALGALGTAAACGFQPLYGEAETNGGGGIVSDQMAAIDVGVIADRSGQQLRSYLLERLNPSGRPASPTYRLEVTVMESQQGLATASDDTVTRSRLRVAADYTLTDLRQRVVVLDRSHITFASFNVQDDLFGNLVSVEGARDRSLRDISEQVRRDVALFLQRRP